MKKAELKAATYNVHAFIGVDKKFKPERIWNIMQEIDADIWALQEVKISKHERDTLQDFVAFHRLQSLFLPTWEDKDSFFGNALLTRLPILKYSFHDISYMDREPRQLIDATLLWKQERIRVIAGHFGLNKHERALQFDHLLSLVEEGEEEDLLVMGDFNEFKWFGDIRKTIKKHFPDSKIFRTFPSWFPILPLDHLWFKSATSSVAKIRAYRSLKARFGSDHLPVTAKIYSKQL